MTTLTDAAVEAGGGEVSEKWRSDDHPPHQWPIGQVASWGDGYGCPTIWCKGEGSQRVAGK